MAATFSVAAPPSGGIAARPLFRDPIFDHATDPVIVYHAESNRWLMYYTQRRGGGITLIHGTKIGVAASEDDGATWKYLGTADITYGQDRKLDGYTYWAPEVIWHDGKYHMFLSFVPGIFDDWRHPREIGHLVSTDGLKWETIGRVDLKSDKVIDACVIQLPNDTWRMFYKDEARRPTLTYADSRDLVAWEVKGNAVTDRNAEGPKVFRWQDKYWLTADAWSGNAIWSSDDCTTWTAQESVLIGNHGDVVVQGDRAWWFYFAGQRPRDRGKINWAALPAVSPNVTPTTSPRTSRLWIDVVELKVVDGKLLHTNPVDPVHIDLGSVRELER